MAKKVKVAVKAENAVPELPREELVGKLSLLKNALAANAAIAVLQHFVFTGVAVYAYNDSVGIKAACELPAPDKFALQGPTLLGLLETCTAEGVSFTPDDTHITVKSGRSTFKLPYLDENSFLFDAPMGLPKVTDVTEKLIAAMEAALVTVSKDLSKPGLSGVCLKRDKTSLTVYSCDGDGMTKAPLAKGGPLLSLMMPAAFCEAVIAVTTKTGAERGILCANDEWAIASFENGYTVYGHLLVVDSPLDYEGLVKDTIKKSTAPYVAIPPGLEASLTRAGVVNKYESAKTHLTVAKDRLTLLTENSVGTIRDVLTFKGHPDVEGDVSAEMTQRAIRLCTQMAIHPGCVSYQHAETGLFILMSNMDK